MKIKLVLFNNPKVKPTLNRKGRFFLVLILLSLGSMTQSFAQSKLFKSLNEQYEMGAELHFYASTLRMININRDPNFDEMVKDIEKMIFFQINDMPQKEMRGVARKFRQEEGFEELMTVEGRQQTLYVLGKDADEFVALLKADGAIMAINVLGMIRVEKIPDLMNSLNADNFLNVFEFGKGERDEHQNNQ